MKMIILEWKEIFPIDEFTIEDPMTDLMLGNLIMYYSRTIKDLTITHLDPSQLTIGVLTIAVFNYSALTEIDSISIFGCNFLSGLGLSNMVANKNCLHSLDMWDCDGIPSEGFHCLTNLTNLSQLYIRNCAIDDMGLNLVSSHCLGVRDLLLESDLLTADGLDHLHCLGALRNLGVRVESDDWLSKLARNTSLTQRQLHF
jgi:hypothetical protein